MGKLTVRHARLRFVMADESTAGFNFLNETDKFYNIVEWNYTCNDRSYDVDITQITSSISNIYDNIIQNDTKLVGNSDTVLRNYCRGIYAFNFGIDEGKVKLTSTFFKNLATAPVLIFSENTSYMQKAKDKTYGGYENILHAIGTFYTDDRGVMISGNRQFLSKVTQHLVPVCSLGQFYTTPNKILKLKKVEPAERGRLGSNLDYRDHHIHELVDYINNKDVKYGDVKFTLDYYQDQFLKDYGFINDDMKKQQLITNLFQKL